MSNKGVESKEILRCYREGESIQIELKGSFNDILVCTTALIKEVAKSYEERELFINILNSLVFKTDED